MPKIPAPTLKALPERVPEWGVSVLESHHAAGFQMEDRRHSFLKVLHVLAGSGRVWVEGRALAFRSGETVLIPPGRTNRVEDDPGHPLSLYVLCVAPRVWSMSPDLLDHLPDGRVVATDLLAERLRGMLRRLLYEQSAGGRLAPWAMAQLALQALTAIGRGHREHEAGAQVNLRNLVEAYVAELGERFFEPANIDDVAAELGMSRRRFTQLFREVTGESWLDHLKRLRMAHARQLLEKTDRTVASIAFECGFGELSNFYRTFSSALGMSPSRWREKHRESEPG